MASPGGTPATVAKGGSQPPFGPDAIQGYGTLWPKPAGKVTDRVKYSTITVNLNSREGGKYSVTHAKHLVNIENNKLKIKII